MSQQVECSNCGAKMTPETDGRTYRCPFCKALQQVAIGADQIAAGMAVDLRNIDAFLSRLANALYQGWSDKTRIDAQGNYVLALEIDLEPEVFIAKREGNKVVAQHKKVVRGIALRTQTLALDRWYEMLTAALARHSNESSRAAWVLGQLGGGKVV